MRLHVSTLHQFSYCRCFYWCCGTVLLLLLSLCMMTFMISCSKNSFSLWDIKDDLMLIDHCQTVNGPRRDRILTVPGWCQTKTHVSDKSKDSEHESSVRRRFRNICVSWRRRLSGLHLSEVPCASQERSINPGESISLSWDAGTTQRFVRAAESTSVTTGASFPTCVCC